MDNLTRAVKSNFSRREVVRWLELQDAYTELAIVQISTIALQQTLTMWEADLIKLRNLKSYNWWLFLSISDYWCTNKERDQISPLILMSF